MILGLLGKAGSGKDTVAGMIASRHLVEIDGELIDIAAVLASDAGLRRHRALRARAVQMALADPIKAYTKKVFDFSLSQLWGPSELRNAPDERYPRPHVPMPDDGPRCLHCGKKLDGVVCSYLTPREALQQLGTEWGRRMWPDTWISLAIRLANEIMSCPRTRHPSGDFTSSWALDRVNLVVFSDVRFRNEASAIVDAGGEVWKIVRPVAGLAGMAGAHASETEQDDIAETSFSEIIVNDGSLEELHEAARTALERCDARGAFSALSSSAP
jgi:hypothetical protein